MNNAHQLVQELKVRKESYVILDHVVHDLVPVDVLLLLLSYQTCRLCIEQDREMSGFILAEIDLVDIDVDLVELELFKLAT
jgi:hypothetical protein